MATIFERLASSEAFDWKEFNWDWVTEQIQKEAARTYFPSIKMAPAKVCVNAWASYLLCPSVTLDDVLCSPSMLAVGSEESMPDPSRPVPKQKPTRVLFESSRTYQADPKKYERHVQDYSEAVLLCSVVVDDVLQAQEAPVWFVHYLAWKHPETGRYSRERPEEGRDLCREWADEHGARMIGGRLITDAYGRRSVASLVQKMDAEFMDCMRAVCRSGKVNQAFLAQNDQPQAEAV